MPYVAGSSSGPAPGMMVADVPSQMGAALTLEVFSMLQPRSDG